jgi:hypothetical protein
MRLKLLVLGLICAAAPAAPADFVNGLALPGNLLDQSGGTTVNDGRVGYFSDLLYDAKRGQWWALSDRGPGGGTLHYATRMQRFKVDIDKRTGAISKFKIVKTVVFKDEDGHPLDGIAPDPTNELGNSFDPEGLVVDPRSGHFLVSDEYGPSVYEFKRNGRRVRTFTTPENLIPRGPDGTPNYASDTGNTAGKRTNRGFEGLAISPDGDFVYAMLQSAMLDEGGGNGVCNRIVKFDTETGTAVAQYAYQMEGASQGRGISALLALSDHELLVLERNNRGIGVGAEATPPNKKVFRIDLDDAVDMTGVTFPATSCPAGKVTKTGPILDLAANTLTALGNKVPEKWEGLAIGPRLDDRSFVMLAGTDNDYSVTQNASGAQFDVYFRMTDADPFLGSIQCPLGQVVGCFFTTGGAPATLTSAYKLLPGVLHAYKVSPDELDAYVEPEPLSDVDIEE